MAVKAEAAPVTFTAAAGVTFHGTQVRFTRDPDREAPGGPVVFSFTAPDAAAAQQVRDLAAAEPGWGITEVSG